MDDQCTAIRHALLVPLCFLGLSELGVRGSGSSVERERLLRRRHRRAVRRGGRGQHDAHFGHLRRGHRHSGGPDRRPTARAVGAGGLNQRRVTFRPKSRASGTAVRRGRWARWGNAAMWRFASEAMLQCDASPAGPVAAGQCCTVTLHQRGNVVM